MHEKSFSRSNDSEVVGIDLELMAKAYEEMGNINLEISNESKIIESEASYTTEEFLKR